MDMAANRSRMIDGVKPPFSALIFSLTCARILVSKYKDGSGTFHCLRIPSTLIISV
jgi:hypothetical protein